MGSEVDEKYARHTLLCELLAQKRCCHESMLSRTADALMTLPEPLQLSLMSSILCRAGNFPGDGDFAALCSSLSTKPRELAEFITECLTFSKDQELDLYCRYTRTQVKHSEMRGEEVNFSQIIGDKSKLVHSLAELVDSEETVAREENRQPQVTYALLDIIAHQHHHIEMILERSREPLHDIGVLATGLVTPRELQAFYNQGYHYCPDQRGRISAAILRQTPSERGQKLYAFYALSEHRTPFQIQDEIVGKLASVPSCKARELDMLLDEALLSGKAQRTQYLVKIVQLIDSNRKFPDFPDPAGQAVFPLQTVPRILQSREIQC